MTEAKGDKKTSGGASSRTATETPSRQIEEVYGKYASSLQDACLAAQTKVGEAERAYLQSLHQVQLDLQKELLNASQQYVTACDAARSKENAAEACGQAQQDYVEAVNAAHVASRNKAEELDRSHREKLEAVRTDHTDSNEASYRSLVKDLQSIWGRVDAGTVDPQDLNLLSHTLLAATQSARGTGS
jgi:hypothetical protein